MIRAISRLSANRSTFTFLVLAIFFSLGAIGIFNHAMWRDELTIWLIARDSESVSEFFNIIRYEPHPALWYLCVAALYRLSHNPTIMQVFHLLLGTSVAFLFLRYSPFKPLHKVLFVFGYLPFYEYLIISRNYSFGVLFAFAFCACFESRKQTYLVLALLLFLMANCNAYSLFIAIALGLTLVVEYAFKKRLNYTTHATLSNKIVSLTILISGILSSIVFLIPPADNIERGGITGGWLFSFDLRHFFTALARIWNSYIVVVVAGDSKYYSVIICGILSLLLFLFFAASFIQKPLILLFYSTATLEIMAFTYTKFLGAQRHFGHLFIVLIVSFWLSHYYPKPEKNRTKAINNSRVNWIQFSERHATSLLVFLLCAQLIGGAIAFSRDLIVPYSASRAAAQYIKASGRDRDFIVGSQDVAMAPLGGYLRRKIYYPERQGLGSFVLFNRTRRDVTIEEVLQQVSQLLREDRSEILLVLNEELKIGREDLAIAPLAQFVESLIYNEKYYLYNATREAPLTDPAPTD
ncbi:MAG: hypothetical protein SW833_15690 [Cyanobacteriota bacterium]|nr:hypothetical protein [Cyanobacteriota bacterium]